MRVDEVHLGPSELDALEKWHDEMGWECAAHSEGQDCCVDMILEAHGRPVTQIDGVPQQ